jgi:O-antigen/teichoic acid export membrane protein
MVLAPTLSAFSDKSNVLRNLAHRTSQVADQVRTATHASLTLADQALMSLTSFIVTVFVGRACSQADFGYFVLGITLGWLVLGIPNALVWVPYATKAPQQTSERRLSDLQGSSTALLLAMAIIIAGVPLLIATGLAVISLVTSAPETSKGLSVCLVPLAVLFFSMMVREHVRRLAIANFQGLTLLRIDIVGCLTQLVIAAFLLHTGRLTLVTGFYAVAAGGIVCGVRLAVVWRTFRFCRRAILVLSNQSWQFGKWLLAIAIFYLAADMSMRGLLTGIHGATELGVFSAAAVIGNIINPLVLAATLFSRSLAAKIFADSGIDGLLRFVITGTAAIAVVLIAAVAGLSTIGPWFLQMMFSAVYADRSVIVAVSLGLCAQALIVPVEGAQMVMEQGRKLFNVSVMHFALSIAAGIPLIWTFGAAGVGITMAIRAVAVLTIQFTIFRRSITSRMPPAVLTTGVTL